MAADAEQLAAIRTWVGSTPDDNALNVIWDRLLSVPAVALEVLGQRQADFEKAPESLSVVGDFSQSTGTNIRSLNDKIAQLTALVSSDSASGIGVSRLARRGPDR